MRTVGISLLSLVGFILILLGIFGGSGHIAERLAMFIVSSGFGAAFIYIAVKLSNESE